MRTPVPVPVRGLLFDFDGLIVDTETPALASWRELYAEHGQELTLERWSAAVGTIDGFDPVAHLRTLAGDVDLADSLARRTARELELVEVEELRPGVLDYLEEARRHGLAVAIVSSGSRPWIDRHLARLERAEHFDDIVTADGDLGPREAAAGPLPRGARAARARSRPRPSPSRTRRTGSARRRRPASSASPSRTASPPSLGLDEADLVVPSLAELPFARLLELAGRALATRLIWCGYPYGGRAAALRRSAHESSDRRRPRRVPAAGEGAARGGRVRDRRRGGHRRRGDRGLRELHPQLVLLDVQLPDLDGFEVSRRLQELNGGVDIVLTSSRDRSDYGSLVTECPVRGFVPKADVSGSAISDLLG